MHGRALKLLNLATKDKKEDNGNRTGSFYKSVTSMASGSGGGVDKGSSHDLVTSIASFSGTDTANLLTKENTEDGAVITGSLHDTVTSIGSASNTNTANILILKDKKVNFVLDERSGCFILKASQDCPTSTNERNIDLTHCILDDITGQFIPIPSSSNDNSSCDLSGSDSDSTFIPDNDDDSSGTDMGTSYVALDETSGLINRKRAKKGQADKTRWGRNQLKRRRQKGQQYSSIKRVKNSGIVGVKVRNQRVMQSRCVSTKCSQSKIKKCNEISDAERTEIFKSFWNMTWEDRKMYVNGMVSLKPVQTQTKGIPSKRTQTLEYSLKVDGEIKPVCKTMFTGTLCLGDWTVTNWVKKAKNKIGMIKKNPPVMRQKAINVTKLEHIRFFLNAVPKMPSHYCRQSSNKMYVDVNYTSWADLYRTFEEYVKDNNIPDEEKATYKCFLRVVNEMNLGIYKPKKDQCDLCYAYKNKNIEEEVYQAHIEAKERAREEKKRDKMSCIQGELQMFTVDLQAVQTIPSIKAGAQYFKLKLCVHQFTIYNEKDASVVCYVWHEAEGRLDANIFTSCLIHFLEGLDDKNTPIIIYSDGCSAQNRNVTLANAMLAFATKYKTEVTQKYLVVGHTQMECDSVHATIETRKKQKELFVPADFVRIIKEARPQEPYQVRYIDHKFFLDYSKMNCYKSIRPGTKAGDPCVVDIRTLKYTDTKIEYKLHFDHDWKLLPQRSTRPSTSEAEKLYSQSLPITTRKFNDLQSMKNLFAKDYHSFYDTLLHE